VPPLPRPGERTRRSRKGLVLGIVAAVLVGVLAGGGGYLFGTGGSLERAQPKSTAGGQPAPAPSRSLGAFEKTQLALNKSKFDGDLEPLATPWMADMGGCLADTDPGGPKLPDNQAKHVSCRYNGVSLNFVRYRSPTDRDAARVYRSRLNSSTPPLVPGQATPGPKTGNSGKPGTYLEYSFKASDGRPVCGIWWNLDEGVAALAMEAACAEVVGGDWLPLRELWQAHS
jgi:hypothetical protein